MSPVFCQILSTGCYNLLDFVTLSPITQNDALIKSFQTSDLVQVTWSVDGLVVGRSAHVSISDCVTENRHAISYLNITDTLVEDSGKYKCEMSNNVGNVHHAAPLIKYRAVFVKLTPHVTVISGEDLRLK